MDLTVTDFNGEGAMYTSYTRAWIVVVFCSTPYTPDSTLQLAHCRTSSAKVHNGSEQQLVLQVFF